jgi:hypothetical protein
MGNKINIFISHKHEDENAARGIKKILKGFDNEKNPKLFFFISEEIIGGANWYQWIKERLEESNLLLLLFTDVTKSWDWCLYEAGLFDRLDENHHKRTICLHSSSTSPPEPLQQLQAFAAHPNRLKTFLKQLFIDTELTGLEEPIAPWLSKVPDKVDEAAKQIAALIDRKPVVSNYFSKYVFIHITKPELLTKREIPPDSRIFTNGKTLEIFDKPWGEWVWGDLEENARKCDDQRWLDELAENIYEAGQGNLPSKMYTLYHAPRTDNVFQPILFRMDKLADGSLIIKILFEDDISWRLDDVPRDHALLLTSLVVATRFKYELLVKYKGKIKNISAEEMDVTSAKILQIILNIESEAASRGILDQSALVKVFKPKDQNTIRKMYEDWGDIRLELIDALSNRNQTEIEAKLKQLTKMSKEYLQLATERFQYIMSEDAGKLA